jgi:hypothetical protein
MAADGNYPSQTWSDINSIPDSITTPRFSPNPVMEYHYRDDIDVIY